MKPLPSAAFLAALALAPAAASATETVDCIAADDSGAIIEMNLGSGMPADIPNWVRVSADGGEWSTLAIDEAATPATIYQAFDDGRTFSIDIADAPVSEVAISIRILRAEEGERVVRAGYLHILGRSIHPITCDFGDLE